MQEQLKTDQKEEYFSGNLIAIDLPRLSTAYADFSNRWYRHQSVTTLKSTGFNLLVEPAYSDVKMHHSQCVIFLLCYQQAEALIRVDRKLINRLLVTLYEEIDFDALSALDQALLLEFLFTPIIENFEQSNLPGVSIKPCNMPDRYHSADIIGGQIMISGSELFYSFEMACLAEHVGFWNELLKRSHISEMTDKPLLEEIINIPLSLNFKSIEMNIGTLKTLEGGDVILFGSARNKEETMEISAAGNQLWLAKKVQNPNAVQILSTRQNTLLAVNSEEYKKGNNIMNDSSESAAINDIPVVLSFEVGRKDITVKQLRDLQEGSIVSFPGENEKEVQIVINGKEVGWGTLVRVGDDVGVKIERIFVNG